MHTLRPYVFAVAALVVAACPCPPPEEIAARPDAIDRGEQVALTLLFAEPVFVDGEVPPKWLFARAPDGLEVSWDTARPAPPPFVAVRVADTRTLVVDVRVPLTADPGAWRFHLTAEDDGICATNGDARVTVR